MRKGAGSVCNSVEELAKLYANERIIGIVNNLIKQGLTDEQIALATGITPEAVHNLR